LEEAQVDVITEVFDQQVIIRQMEEVQQFRNRVKYIGVRVNNQHFLFKRFTPLLRGYLSRIQYLKPVLKQDGLVLEHMGDIEMYFERLNGFPNYWAWGQEDNCIQHRAMKIGMPINRNNFFKIGDHNVLQLFDGLGRTIMKGDIARTRADNGMDGIRTIRNLNFNFVDHDIVVKSFDTPREWSDEDYQPINIIKGRQQQRKVGLLGNIYR